MQLVAAEVKKPPSGTISVPKSSYDVSHIKPFCMLLYAVEISNIYVYSKTAEIIKFLEQILVPHKVIKSEFQCFTVHFSIQ